MPGTNTSGSSNIALLDSKIVADLCGGAFYIDVTPSIWIGTGYNNVEGADVRITNPYGVVIKEYPTSGYDIYPPMTAVIGINIPTQAGNFQYGTYTVEVRLTDSDGTEYTVSKPVNICQPDAQNKTRNYGSLSAELNGICLDGKMYVIVNTPPNYKGNVVQSQVNDFTLEYPTSSGIDELETSVTSFSTYLFEGVYKITGTICATYNNGDNVFFKVNYKVKRKKEVYCSIDDCCVSWKLNELSLLLDTDCTQAEKDNTNGIIGSALFYLKQAEMDARCGNDPSDAIAKLEAVLGCKCTCNCNEGTPIINNNPAKDFNITGCNVIKTTVGLTDSYVINNYAYTTAVVPNGGVLTIGAQTESSCTKTQPLSFSISVAYAQIKNLANATSDQATFWAYIINKTLAGIDATCIGYTGPQWNGMTFPEKITALMAFMCDCCGCAATIVSSTVTKVGANALLSWVATGEYSIDIYMDGIFIGSVLSTEDSFTIIGAADGQEHVYLLIPKCSNNKPGTDSVGAHGSFTLFECAQIEPPSVSSNNVNGAACPYDLTGLVSSLPSGITAEWHTANNTNASSLLGDPTSVSSGSYYVFAKDSEGCYSIGINVIVVCSSESDCTAPQTLFVSSITGGNLVQFQSAAFPPPMNSYTVKRKLASAPDISGSYTTIGTPSWNPSSSRWEILDATAVNNTLYTYKAQSNCGGSDTPYVLYNYGFLVCPDVTYTPDEELIQYSFAPVGGQVDKYLVELYDGSGVTLLHTDTHVPAFSNPTTGTFMYLTSNTSYKIRVKVYIGTYYTVCGFTDVETASVGDVVVDAVNNTALNSSLLGVTINSVAVTGITFPLHEGGETGTGSTTQSGTVPVTVHIFSNQPGQIIQVVDSNGTVQCQTVTIDPFYFFTGVVVSGAGNVTIELTDGSCV